MAKCRVGKIYNCILQIFVETFPATLGKLAIFSHGMVPANGQLDKEFNNSTINRFMTSYKITFSKTRVIVASLCVAALPVLAADETMNSSSSSATTSSDSSATAQPSDASSTRQGTLMQQEGVRDSSETSPKSNAAQYDANSAQRFARAAAWGGMKEIRLSQIALQKSDNPQVKQFANHIISDHSAANQQLTQIAQNKGYTLPAANAFETASYRSTYGSEFEPTSERSAPSQYSPPPASDSRSSRNAMQSQDAATRQQGQDWTAQPGEPQRSESTPSPSIDTKGGRIANSPSTISGGNAELQMQTDFRTANRLESLSGKEFDQAYIKQMVEDHQKAISKFETAQQNVEDAELKQFASDTLPKLRDHLKMAQDIQASL